MIELEKSLKSLFISGLDGDQQSYRQFLELLLGALRGLIAGRLRRYGSRDSDVDDIVQETIIALHNKRHTYDRVTPVTAWVSAIALYKMIDALRASARLSSGIPLDDVEMLAAEDELDIDLQLSVRDAIGNLPRKMRTSIEMVKVQGHSIKEASSAIGISEPAVKTSIHRGLKHMFGILK